MFFSRWSKVRLFIRTFKHRICEGMRIFGLEGFYNPLAFFYHLDKVILAISHSEPEPLGLARALRLHRRAPQSDIIQS